MTGGFRGSSMFDEEAKISRYSLVESAIAPELRVDCAVGFAPHFGRCGLDCRLPESGR